MKIERKGSENYLIIVDMKWGKKLDIKQSNGAFYKS